MKNRIVRNMTAAVSVLLVLMLVLSCTLQARPLAEKAHPGQAPAKLSAPRLARGARNDAGTWQSNMLTPDPLGIMFKDKDQIATVTFLDDLNDLPRNAWAMGKGGAPVWGWVEWDQSRAHVYFAAQGGINGELAAEGLFQDCVNLYEICFNGALHLETTKDMDNMFFNCERLEYVDTENMDTSSATTMSQMFRNCYALEELDVSSFDTSSVKNMGCMFSTCYSLTELDLSNFDTSRVTEMGYMFSACRGLEDLDVSSFDTSRVTSMEGMFRWCYSLVEPDLSSWNVSRVQNHYGFMDEGKTINGRPWEYFFN